MTHFIHNGELIPAAEAKISVDSIEWTYGFGVYENLKVRNGKIYFTDKHIDRLFESARLIGLEHSFEKSKVGRWINELVQASLSPPHARGSEPQNAARGGENFNIKILLIGGKTTADANLYIMTLAPKFLPKKFYTQGVHTITRVYERFLPQAKTLNMLPSYLFFKEARAAGAHDTLLIGQGGYILEGTRSNFFAIKDKTLFTAPLDRVLNGVTRQTVIEGAKDNNYKIKENYIKLNKINEFDGACLTHTSGNIVPIKSIDEFSFPVIPDTLKELMKRYDEYLRDK